MAVRQLKWYVSWVQTVEKRSFSTSKKYKVESSKKVQLIDSLNPLLNDIQKSRFVYEIKIENPSNF